MTMFPPKEKATSAMAWPPYNDQIDYDWTKPTVQIYKAKNRESANDDDDDETHHHRLPETFLRERQKLDYSYHDRLIYSRLVFQDSIIAQIKNAAKPQREGAPAAPEAQQHDPPPPPLDRPWLIFTAGPMGVGKGYVLAQLQHMAVLNTRHNNYIIIDPDMIKTELPEMAGYEHASAATLLHAESSQMADVLLEHGLSLSYNLLVDGSLRNVVHYQQLLHRIRQEFPNYQIAILHVTASADTILHRARHRVGRAVPESLVNESIQQVPLSVEALTPLVDAVHVIRNEKESTVQLEKSIRVIRQQQQQQQQQHEDGVGKDDAVTKTTITVMVETKNPSWEMFAKSWKPIMDCEQNQEEGECLSLKPPLNVSMDQAFWSKPAHQLACTIWNRAYPHFCARCTLCRDGQCGVCRHGRHRCACRECEF